MSNHNSNRKHNKPFKSENVRWTADWKRLLQRDAHSARVQHLAQTAGFYSSESPQQLILLISCCTQAEDWNQLLSPLIGEKSCRLLALRKADRHLLFSFAVGVLATSVWSLALNLSHSSVQMQNHKPGAARPPPPPPLVLLYGCF